MIGWTLQVPHNLSLILNRNSILCVNICKNKTVNGSDGHHDIRFIMNSVFNLWCMIDSVSLQQLNFSPDGNKFANATTRLKLCVGLCATNELLRFVDIER